MHFAPRRLARTCALLLAASACLCAHAADRVVKISGNAFVDKILNVSQGTRLVFVNDDPFPHSVLSFSPTQTFDLGLLPAAPQKPAEAKAVTLAKPGTVEIECGLHPNMKLTVEVAK